MSLECLSTIFSRNTHRKKENNKKINVPSVLVRAAPQMIPDRKSRKGMTRSFFAEAVQRTIRPHFTLENRDLNHSENAYSVFRPHFSLRQRRNLPCGLLLDFRLRHRLTLRRRNFQTQQSPVILDYREAFIFEKLHFQNVFGSHEKPTFSNSCGLRHVLKTQFL